MIEIFIGIAIASFITLLALSGERGKIIVTNINTGEREIFRM